MTEPRYDIAFTQEADGTMLLHWADCKRARQAAAQGLPVATLYGCEMIPTDTKRCSCMSEPEYPVDHPAPGDLGSIPL